MDVQDLPSITPINFFQISLNCYYLPIAGKFPRINSTNMGQYVLPDTSVLCHEEHFANVAMGWNEEGIECMCVVHKKFEDAFYPDVIRGDSVEIFFDTRDVKSSGYNTRFCHHFFFLPEEVDGHQVGELTHFRTEDRHVLCDAETLDVKVHFKKNSYILSCFIPRTSLFGYDSEQFDRLGFSYRINRPYWESQHFAVVTEDYKLEQQPSLWSSIRLVK